MDFRLDKLFDLALILGILIGFGLIIYCKTKNVSLREAWEDLVELFKGGGK